VKILHVAGICPAGPSGGTRLVVDLACGLKTRFGISGVVVGEVSSNRTFCACLKEAGVEVIDMFVPRLVAAPLESLRALYRLLSHPSIVGTDIVHAHAFITTPMLVARLLRKRFIVTAHGVHSRLARRTRACSRSLRRSLYSSADGIVAVSSHVRRDLLATFGENSLDVNVIQNGCDTRSFTPGEPTNANAVISELHAAGSCVVGIVGRMDQDKRPLDVVDLAETTLADLPKLAFVFVGSGTVKEAIRTEIARRGLTGRVSILGYQTNMVDIYRQIDVLLHMTPDEPFGLVLIEAMSCALPVVAAAGGAANEIVVDKETGHLCTLGRTSEWTEAFRALQHAEARRKFGRAGRARVLQHFAIECMVDAYKGMYRRILEQ